MAEDQTAEQEPSIEEILDSIRQIISDDEEGGGSDEAEVAPEEAPKEDVPAEEDVIELTDRVEEPDSGPSAGEGDEADVSEAPAEPEENAAEQEKKEVGAYEVDVEDTETEPEPDAEPAPEPEPEPPQSEEPEVEEGTGAESMSSDDSILSESAEEAAYEGFSELARKTAVEHDGITLEEIVRTEIKPLLKDWLDKNLPSLIERLVQEELERISKKVTSD